MEWWVLTTEEQQLYNAITEQAHELIPLFAQRVTESVFGTSLENCISAHILEPEWRRKAGENMAKHRMRIQVDKNDDNTPVIKQLSANSEIELGDRIVREYIASGRIWEFMERESKPVEEKAQGVTFREYAGKWFKLYKAKALKPTTASGYQSVLHGHLYPAFGDKRMQEIRIEDIQTFLNERDDRAEKTLKDILILLRSILDAAVEEGMLESNPARSKLLTIPSKRKRVREALTVEEVTDILANLPKLDLQEQRYMLCLIFTGARRGEILGLQWEDIDFAEKLVHIRRNVTFPGGANTGIIGTPKTQSGARSIPVTEAFLAGLQHGGETGFVLGGEKPFTKIMERRMLERIGKRIDLHGATAHVFRHTYATMLAQSGTSIKVTQAMIGHSDVQTTMRYVHSDGIQERVAAEHIGEMLAG